MSYWMLNGAFLGLVAAVLLTAIVTRRSPRWRAIALTGLLVLVLTAVFDNLMIALGLFGYNPEHISGSFVGLAPLEDFAYAIAAVVLLPTLWDLLETRRRQRD